MPQIIITKPFRFAHGGHQVEAFEPGEAPVDTTDECAELAIAEGWATAVQTSAPQQLPNSEPNPAADNKPLATAEALETAATPAAPSNRAAKPSRAGGPGA